MPYVIVGTENDQPIEIHYEDHGSGTPIVLIHGYPLDGKEFLNLPARSGRRSARGSLLAS
jgi:pimeloyl-ACP methyl ester carboxylesterase